MPLPRSLNIFSDCVPAGIFKLTLPSSVGTVVEVPSAACAKRNVYLADHVDAVALEKLVFFFLNQHDKVAGRAAVEPAVALARHRKIISFRNTGRNVDRDRCLRCLAAGAIALMAGVHHDLALAVADRAHGFLHKLSEKGIGNMPDPAGAVALLARCLFAAFGPASFTFGTGVFPATLRVFDTPEWISASVSLRCT